MRKTLKTALCVSLSIAAAGVLAKEVINSSLAAKIHLEQQDKRLYSHITLTQPQDKAGNITVAWTAPQHSYCLNSTYPLDYKYTRYRTRAYRTVIHTNAKGQTQVCAGTWKVQVLDANKQVLASDAYVVKAAAAETAAN